MEKENVVSPNEVSLLFESRISTTLVFWSWQDCMFYSSLQLLKSFAILGCRLLNPPLLTYLELIASQVKEVKEFRLCSNLLNIEIYQLQNSFSDPQHNICTSSSLKEHRICKKKNLPFLSLSAERRPYCEFNLQENFAKYTFEKLHNLYSFIFEKYLFSVASAVFSHLFLCCIQHWLLNICIHTSQSIVSTWYTFKVAQGSVLVSHHFLHHCRVSSKFYCLRKWNV